MRSEGRVEGECVVVEVEVDGWIMERGRVVDIDIERMVGVDVERGVKGGMREEGGR